MRIDITLGDLLVLIAHFTQEPRAVASVLYRAPRLFIQLGKHWSNGFLGIGELSVNVMQIDKAKHVCNVDIGPSIALSNQLAISAWLLDFVAFGTSLFDGISSITSINI